MSEVWAALEGARAAREQQASNTARQAVCTLRVSTTGVGEALLEAPLELDVAFLEAPQVSTGAVVTSGPDLALWRYPMVSAGVRRWVYTGELVTAAWVFLAVQCDPRQPTLLADPDYLEQLRAAGTPAARVEHHLSFSGVAMQRGALALAQALTASVRPTAVSLGRA